MSMKGYRIGWNEQEAFSCHDEKLMAFLDTHADSCDEYSLMIVSDDLLRQILAQANQLELDQNTVNGFKATLASFNGTAGVVYYIFW